MASGDGLYLSAPQQWQIRFDANLLPSSIAEFGSLRRRRRCAADAVSISLRPRLLMYMRSDIMYLE